jgi:flagellar hook-length control protein FliK
MTQINIVIPVVSSVQSGAVAADTSPVGADDSVGQSSSGASFLESFSKSGAATESGQDRTATTWKTSPSPFHGDPYSVDASQVDSARSRSPQSASNSATKVEQDPQTKKDESRANSTEDSQGRTPDAVALSADVSSPQINLPLPEVSESTEGDPGQPSESAAQSPLDGPEPPSPATVSRAMPAGFLQLLNAAGDSAPPTAAPPDLKEERPSATSPPPPAGLAAILTAQPQELVRVEPKLRSQRSPARAASERASSDPRPTISNASGHSAAVTQAAQTTELPNQQPVPTTKPPLSAPQTDTAPAPDLPKTVPATDAGEGRSQKVQTSAGTDPLSAILISQVAAITPSAPAAAIQQTTVASVNDASAPAHSTTTQSFPSQWQTAVQAAPYNSAQGLENLAATPEQTITAVTDVAPVAASTPPISSTNADQTSTKRDSAASPTHTPSFSDPSSSVGSQHEAPMAGQASSASQSVDTARRLQQIADRVADVLRNGFDSGGQLRVRLEPPALGKIQIDVTTNEDGVSARVEVQTSAARDQILNNLPLLHDAISQAGVGVSRIDVFVGATPRDDSHSDRGDGSGRGQRDANQHGPQDENQQQPGGRQQGRQRRRVLPIDQLDIEI